MALYSPQLIRKLEEDIKNKPQSKSFCALAHIYYKQGQIQKAKTLCLQGLKHHPSYSQALILLAEIHFKENQCAEALKLLNKAKELNPDNPHIYKNLAQIYKKQNQPEKTLSAYKMLAFLSPNDSLAAASVRHLEKILGPALVSEEKQAQSNKEKAFLGDQRILSREKKLTEKQSQKLIKLNQILACVENYIEQTLKA